MQKLLTGNNSLPVKTTQTHTEEIRVNGTLSKMKVTQDKSLKKKHK